jgi:glycosyltransferase involved in cell wall biosynthesis
VLVIHSRYRSGAASGENRVVEDELRLLASAGHDVASWLPEPEVDGLARVRTGISAIWSRSAVNRLRQLIDDSRPDVIHVHNLFPVLSPAVIRVSHDADVPVLLTLHNYRLLCAAGTLLREGRICEKCVGRSLWRAVPYRCYRTSASGSAALALSLATHRRIGTFEMVTRFLAVSAFVREKHLEAGLDPTRIVVKPNFAWPTGVREGAGEYFLYVGRLSAEKGVDVLLETWRTFERPPRLVIVGDGPDMARLRRAAPAGITFAGAMTPADVSRLLRNARALVAPSKSYEGCPRVVMEAYAAGVPVLGSRLGALPEFVDEGVTGYLAAPGDVREWRGIIAALGDDALSLKLGRSARRMWAREYTPARALSRLEEIYARAAGLLPPPEESVEAL